ncbi:MAG: cytochrome c3 family protein, partial [Planctomycetota bacterium]
EAKVGCTKCHGISAGHANDENIGATKPDVLFKSDQINKFCLTCHEPHDLEPTKQALTCTQCHGRHKIGDG